MSADGLKCQGSFFFNLTQTLFLFCERLCYSDDGAPHGGRNWKESRVSSRNTEVAISSCMLDDLFSKKITKPRFH